MEWIIIAVSACFGFWNWRQRNAFRLRAYLLEQKYIHGASVDRAIAAQLGRDRIELAMIGMDSVAADLLGRRETMLQLEREAERLAGSAPAGHAGVAGQASVERKRADAYHPLPRV